MSPCRARSVRRRERGPLARGGIDARPAAVQSPAKQRRGVSTVGMTRKVRVPRSDAMTRPIVPEHDAGTGRKAAPSLVSPAKTGATRDMEQWHANRYDMSRAQARTCRGWGDFTDSFQAA